jgi:hypothetical protein
MSLINPIAIIKKWANGTTATADVVLPPVTTSTIIANQEIGFPPAQEQDPTTGGQYVKRAEMNGVFKLYSQHIEFLNKGGSYTFNTDIATAGGYSTGATLWSDYYKRFVTSLKDNNTDNFITDINKIDGISWGFTEISDYISVPEIPITGDLTTNGTEIVVYCGKQQFTNNGLFNVKIKFALKNSEDFGVMYSLSFMGNPRFKLQPPQYVLNNYTTNILLADNYTGANLEIKTYGGNLGAISEKASDYIFIVLKIVGQPTGRTDWQNPFILSDVCIEGIGTILPVIGKTLSEANTMLGTNNILQNQEPRRLYFPSIIDIPSNVNIDNYFTVMGTKLIKAKFLNFTDLANNIDYNISATISYLNTPYLPSVVEYYSVNLCGSILLKKISGIGAQVIYSIKGTTSLLPLTTFFQGLSIVFHGEPNAPTFIAPATFQFKSAVGSFYQYNGAVRIRRLFDQPNFQVYISFPDNTSLPDDIYGVFNVTFPAQSASL